MTRRALAVLPLLAAAAALAAGLEDVPRAAPLLAGLCAAAAFAAAFFPEAPPRWLCAAAAFAAVAAARVFGVWTADPAFGFALIAAAGAAGAALGAAGEAPTEAAAPAWAAAGGLLVAALPVFLRFLGQNFAAPARLFYAVRGAEWTLLAQPAALAAAAAAALARAARGLARPARGTDALAAVAGAALAAALIPRLDAAFALGAAGGFLALAAAVRARPLRDGTPRTLLDRAVVAAAAAALLLAAASPLAVLKVWTARLDSLYPGGRFLAQIDDGAVVWSAYRFSRGERVLLRDGLIQRDDALAAILALDVALGQHSHTDCSILLVRPPGPQTVFAAGHGCGFAVEDGTASETAVLNAELGLGWRKELLPAQGKFDVVLTVLPLPYGRSARRLVSADRLAAARERTAKDGAAVFLLPTFAGNDAALEELRKSAAAVFGVARSAMLPTGDGLVYAASAEPITDAQLIFLSIPEKAHPEDPVATRNLLAAIRWLPTPGSTPAPAPAAK